MSDMKLLFISSPFREFQVRNIEYAKDLLKEAIDAGYVPIAPHLLYPQVLDDDNITERKIAMELCQELIKKCDAVLVGKKYGISRGMRSEIELARKLGKKIIWKK